MKKRISKALASAGVGSRRACELLVQQGRIAVNGRKILLPQTLVEWERDAITLDGKAIKREEKKVYFALNKPPGFLCTTTAPGKKVLDLFSHLPQRLFTVGRLDKETSGLLLITNDGDFSNRVIHPSYGITKEYLAKTNHEITLTHLKALSKGTFVQGAYIKPLLVKKVRRGTVKIVVAEGRKREVRWLLENAGLPVLELCRIRIGPLTLGNLPLGHYRKLSFQEINFFSANR